MHRLQVTQGLRRGSQFSTFPIHASFHPHVSFLSHVFLIIIWIFHPQHTDILKKAPFPPGLPGDAQQPSYAHSSNLANIIYLLGPSQVLEEKLHILDISGSWCGARKNEARSAEKWCTQRSLTVLTKEYMRVWYLAKVPIKHHIISSLASHLYFIVHVCVSARISLCVCPSFSLSPALCVSLSIPVSFSYPFLPLFTSPFQTPFFFKPVFPGCWKTELTRVQSWTRNGATSLL